MFIEPYHAGHLHALWRARRRICGVLSSLVIFGIATWIMPDSSLSLGPRNARAEAPDLIIDMQVSDSTPAPGAKFSYLIRYRCAGVEEHCSNAQISDAISSALKVVDYTRVGGNIANVQVDKQSYVWNLESILDSSSQLSAGSSGSIQIIARFPACGEQIPAAGTKLSNVAHFTADNAAPASSAPTGADITVPVIEPCPEPEMPMGEGFRKTDWDEIFANPGNSRVTYEIFLVDSSVGYVVEDEFPDGLTLESVLLSNLIEAGGRVELRCAGIWYDLTSTLTDRLNNPDDVPGECSAEQAFATGTAYWFTNAEAIRFRTPNGFNIDETVPLTLIFFFDVDYPVGGILRNTATLYEPDNVDLNGDGIPGQVVVSHADKEVVDPSLMGSNEVDEFILPGYLDADGISILDGNKKLPAYVAAKNTNHSNLNLTEVYLAQNDVVWTYRAQLRNDSTLGMNWVNPVMVVDFPKEMEFVQDPEIGNFIQISIPNRSTITKDYDPYNNSNCETPEITVFDNFNGSGRTRLRMDFPGCTIYGGLQQYAGIALYFSGRLKPGVPLDTQLVTDFRMVDENGLMFRCFGNDTVYKNWCGTRNTIAVSGLPSESYTTLESYVFAKGSLDAEFHRFPELGYTGGKGQVDYEAYVLNTGNVVHRYIDFIDVLPHLNDSSITTSERRNSSWEQELRSPVTLERLDLTTGQWTAVPEDQISRGPYYSMSTNPCRLSASGGEIRIDDDLAVLPSGCDPVPWKPIVTDPLGMRSTGLRWVPPQGFGPSEEVRIGISAQQATSTEFCSLFTDSFGTGNARADLAPETQTSLQFDASGAVDAGSYALMSSLRGLVDDSGSKWHNVADDLTPDDTDGRMMVINATGATGEIYRKTVTDLVVNADYTVTAWVANAHDGQASDLPSLRLSIEPAGGGTALSSFVTDPIKMTDTVNWNAYSIGFTSNASSVDFVLSVVE